jgi:hypothetical protein
MNQTKILILSCFYIALVLSACKKTESNIDKASEVVQTYLAWNRAFKKSETIPNQVNFKTSNLLKNVVDTVHEDSCGKKWFEGDSYKQEINDICNGNFGFNGFYSDSILEYNIAGNFQWIETWKTYYNGDFLQTGSNISMETVNSYVPYQSTKWQSFDMYYNNLLNNKSYRFKSTTKANITDIDSVNRIVVYLEETTSRSNISNSFVSELISKKTEKRELRSNGSYEIWNYYMISGKEKVTYTTNGQSGEFIIDYGNGEIDNIATITENGISFKIDIKSIEDMYKTYFE